MKEILIQRVGNLILRGEGLGVHVIDHLPTDTLLPTIELLNSSTENLAITDSLQKYRCSVLINTSLDRKRSGTIRYLNPRHTHNFPSPRSIHELSLKKDDRSQNPHRYTVPTSISSPCRWPMSKKPATPDGRYCTSYSINRLDGAAIDTHIYIQNIDKYGRENSYLYRQ